jgi:hypothetical protein
MFGKKKSQRIDLANAQFVALQSFFKVYEVLHGYEFSAPKKYEEGVKLVSQEPEYNTVDVWPTLFSEMRFTDTGVFVFQFRDMEYSVTIKHADWNWGPHECKIVSPEFVASAKKGYCHVLGHQCIVIDCEEPNSGKKWRITGTSSKHRIKAGPEEFERAHVGMNVVAEKARLRKLHRI